MYSIYCRSAIICLCGSIHTTLLFCGEPAQYRNSINHGFGDNIDVRLQQQQTKPDSASVSASITNGVTGMRILLFINTGIPTYSCSYDNDAVLLDNMHGEILKIFGSLQWRLKLMLLRNEDWHMLPPCECKWQPTLSLAYCSALRARTLVIGWRQLAHYRQIGMQSLLVGVFVRGFR